MDIEKLVVKIDNREKKNMNITSRFQLLNIKWMPCTLKYGDYSFEYDGKSYEKILVIEKKSSLTELSGNICQGRIRFETEFSKAKADNCKMILLIEDEKAREKMKLRIAMENAGIDLETKYRKTWRTKCTGNGMVGSIKALKDRYDLDLIFCSKRKTASEIIRIFQDYLKELLENGL